MTIRRAEKYDQDRIWEILEPVIRAGETYTVPRDFTREEALAYWFADGHEVWVAEEPLAGRQGASGAADCFDGGLTHSNCVNGEEQGAVLGTYFLQANQRGGGSHVANCGYMTARGSEGRGLARAMCAHSLDRARERGFRAMQFNFVVSTNERAVRLWESFGFEVVGRLPGAFEHPSKGYVDALVMYLKLDMR